MRITLLLGSSALLCLTLASCGGGDTQTAPSQSQPPPPTLKVTKAVRLATIEWFSSTPDISAATDASILIDGEAAAFSDVDLSQGEVVLASGEFDPNTNLLTADHLEVSHPVDGPLDEMDLVHGRLKVLGQAVLVEGRTIIDGGELAAYKPGDRLAVSGHLGASGEVVATRIKPSALTGDFLVTGFVSSVSDGHHQLTVGDLVVDYGTATLTDFGNTRPAAGNRVRAKGTRTDSVAPLVVTSLELLSPTLPGATGASVSLEGVVTSELSPMIEVDGYPVSSGAVGQGSCTSTPGLNARVTVGGALQPGGSVMADAICFDDLAQVSTGLKITGRIDAVDSAFGAVSVLGFAIQSSPTTHVVDQTGSTIPFSTLKAGEFVTASGSGGPADGLLLTWRTQRANSTTASVEALWGHGVRLANPYVFVVGRPIAIDAQTTFSGFLAPEPMTPERFFGDRTNWGRSWDRFCPPNFKFEVDARPDGSLVATSVTLTQNWDHC